MFKNCFFDTFSIKKTGEQIELKENLDSGYFIITDAKFVDKDNVSFTAGTNFLIVESDIKNLVLLELNNSEERFIKISQEELQKYI